MSSNKSKAHSVALQRHLHVFDADSRALINHHDAVAVTHLQDLLSVGVVAGAEGVGSQPLEQVEVLDSQRPIKPFPPDLQHIRRGTRWMSGQVDFMPPLYLENLIHLNDGQLLSHFVLLWKGFVSL